MWSLSSLLILASLSHALPQVAPTITPAALMPRGLPANFIGWSSWTTRGGTTSYVSQHCDTSLSYATSVVSGTTYGQCCKVGNDNCATSTFAHSCVGNVEMAGTVTLRDCGTLTCNHALIFQNYGGTAEAPIYWHGCMSDARGGTYYRTMPANAGSAASFSTTYVYHRREGLSGTAVAGIVVGSILGFALFCVCLPLWCLKQREYEPKPTKQKMVKQKTTRTDVATPGTTKIYQFFGVNKFALGKEESQTGEGGVVASKVDEQQPPRYDEISVQNSAN